MTRQSIDVKLFCILMLNRTFTNMDELIDDYKTGALHPADVKPALAKAINQILQVKFPTFGFLFNNMVPICCLLHLTIVIFSSFDGLFLLMWYQFRTSVFCIDLFSLDNDVVFIIKTLHGMVPIAYLVLIMLSFLFSAYS
jgi:hypothetical protein